MKIVYLITRADAIGGASIHVRDMARAMRERGHDAQVLIGGKGEVTEALDAAGVPHRTIEGFQREIDPRADLRALLALRRALREIRPDLVSAHTSKAGFLGRLAARSLGIPVLYTPHCWSFVEGFPRAKLYLWAERFAAPFGTRIVAVSEVERRQALDAGVCGAAKIVTIHNGMPDVPETLRADPSCIPPRMCMIGRFEMQKDHETLLRALGGLRDLPWSLTLVGDGPTRPQMEQLAVDLKIRDRIDFLGYRSDVAEVLAKAQVYLLASHWESFPRSILEAMRAGLPVVASDVGGTAESVADGMSGFVVPRRDPAALGERVRTLLSDAALRTRMGQASRQRYEERFTFDRMVERYLELYEEIRA